MQAVFVDPIEEAKDVGPDTLEVNFRPAAFGHAVHGPVHGPETFQHPGQEAFERLRSFLSQYFWSAGKSLEAGAGAGFDIDVHENEPVFIFLAIARQREVLQ